MKKASKSGTLISTTSYVVSIACNLNGNFLVSGHMDHTIFKVDIEKNEKVQLTVHSTVPYCLEWGINICAAGNDGKVIFYDERGGVAHQIDYSNDPKVKEFTGSACNPSGENICLGNFNKFFLYAYNQRRGIWDELACKNVPNLYSVSAISWKKDGSKIVIGNLCGSVDMFDVFMANKAGGKKGKFEITYVSPSHVNIKRIDNGERTQLKSSSGSEITRINIYKDRFLVANTSNTLMLGDLETGKLSEVPYRGSGNEKYDFHNPDICMVFNAGELMLIEYGVNEIMGTCRTDYVHPNLLSARLQHVKNKENSARIIAFLSNKNTIKIQDIANNLVMTSIEHDSKIIYLELNVSGTKLIFRDARKQLVLYNLIDQKKNTLLNYCTFASWVIGSEVVVAQSKSILYVWYSIEDPDKVTLYDIKGDILSIERNNGKTEVIIDAGVKNISCALDEGLISFNTAIEQGDLSKAAMILDPLELNNETEANWKALAKLALQQMNIGIAERCYAALGNVARARYLRNVSKLMAKYEEETKQDGKSFYLVQAKLSILSKEFAKAESLLLSQNEVDEAMIMYQELHKWDESIKIAEMSNHPEVKDLKLNYLNWLLDTNQEGKAAELKEREGDFVNAINLYLKGGMPAKAAAVVQSNAFSPESQLLERIASALISTNMYEKAGDFYERMENYEKALDCYVKGHVYYKAVEMSKRSAPNLAVKLEEEWGDWLVSQKQVDASINHFIEAGIFSKAIEASIQARQWSKAVQLLSSQPAEVARPFYKQIGKHYAEVRQYDLSEKYLVLAGEFVEAFEVYVKANKWDQAYHVATKHLAESEVSMLYVKEGQKLEKDGLYKEAERMYITVSEPDLAINMYKKAKQYDSMIRLVMKYRRDLLKETHLVVARQLETEGNTKVAEHHYIESGNWQGAVDMYRARDQWEEAIRVAKSNGTAKEVADIAKKWAQTMEKDAALKMLMKLGLIDAAIDLECEKKAFDEAFRLANSHAKYKLTEVHLKYAISLEDEGKFNQAEEEYVKANKATEAIDMYEHLEHFDAALQVARRYCPENVTQVYVDQANFYFKKKEYAKAEQSFINAKHPELAITCYLQNKMWTEALRMAKKHAPHLAEEINKRYSVNVNQKEGATGEDLLTTAKMWENSKDYIKAIDAYLDINEKHYSDIDIVIQAWEKAVNLAMTFDKDRAQDIITEVGQRLTSIKKFEQAGELYESVGFFENAIQCYVIAKVWEKAREVVRQVKNPHQKDQFTAYVEKAYKNHLIETNQLDVLVNQGDVGGLELLMQRGEWDECLTLANKKGADVLVHYLVNYAKLLMKDSKFTETALAITKYNSPPHPSLFQIYKTLALEVLAEAELNDSELIELKNMLSKLIDNLSKESGKDNNIFKEFKMYLDISYLEILKAECKALNIGKCYSKICISLLRYTKEIRPDKAFLDAGMACRSQKNDGLAFLLLNRYLYLADAIQDPDSANLADNTDFENSDIPGPYDLALPEQNLMNEQKRGEIKEWVLQMVVLPNVSKTLPTRACDKCSTQIYEASLKCFKCKNEWDICIASGYPLIKHGSITCKGCGKGAMKEFWNDYVKVSQKCPWCKSMQTTY